MASATIEVFGDTDKELYIQHELMDVPPFNTPAKKLRDALTAVEQGRVTLSPTREDAYEVHGSQGTAYTVTTDGCTCKASQYSQRTKYACYHAVAAELFHRWTRAVNPAVPLPLLTIPHTERPMPDTMMIPEPIAPPAPMLPAVVPPSPPPAPLTSQMLEGGLQEWGKQRATITRYIKAHFKKGTDYYTLEVKGTITKPSLGKPGAEKFMSLFQLTASFRKDQDTWEMLGNPVGILCYICTLHTRSGEVVGEGRGARDIKKDSGDINKAIKMAQKSAQIDAILRTGALSDVFTQDLEDSKGTHNDRDERREIVRLVKALGYNATTPGEYGTIVQEVVKLPLTPEHYNEIIARLKEALDALELQKV